MLTQIHFILTYACNFECDHCFLHSGPTSKGTFTISQVTEILDEGKKIGTVDWIYYEGGEPFLYYPLLLESMKRANAKGYKIGLVTNAYGAHADEDAALWLKPLMEAGLSYLNISNDIFHYGEEPENTATTALSTAEKLGIKTSPICIEPPEITQSSSSAEDKGRPVVGGGAMFRGRAVEKLTEGLPLRPWSELRECPYEELQTPSRVHIDPYGNVHVCQGISIGNMWKTPLSEIIRNYRPDSHPICAPLIRGGPAALAEESGVEPQSGYVDECHLCYLTRKAMIDRYPEYLAPEQVYGL